MRRQSGDPRAFSVLCSLALLGCAERQLAQSDEAGSSSEESSDSAAEVGETYGNHSASLTPGYVPDGYYHGYCAIGEGDDKNPLCSPGYWYEGSEHHGYYGAETIGYVSTDVSTGPGYVGETSAGEVTTGGYSPNETGESSFGDGDGDETTGGPGDGDGDGDGTTSAGDGDGDGDGDGSTGDGDGDGSGGNGNATGNGNGSGNGGGNGGGNNTGGDGDTTGGDGDGDGAPDSSPGAHASLAPHKRAFGASLLAIPDAAELALSDLEFEPA